jgi:regulator of cell morphogenesis and NO signaling
MSGAGERSAGFGKKQHSARRNAMSDTATIATTTMTRAVADAPQETGALIDHILTRYHETHRRELPELVQLARRVEAVHADHAAVPRGLSDLLHQILGEIEVHMKKEELILFPAMRRGVNGLAVPITQMRHDHDDQDAQLHAAEQLTDGFRPPQDACGSWRALYERTAKFADDFAAHLHLENDVLFPRFEQTAAPQGETKGPLP